jgi:hypothetical protein
VGQGHLYAEPIQTEAGVRYWLPGPTTSGSLYWAQGDLRLQLMTTLSRDEAIAIAASVAPLAE